MKNISKWAKTFIICAMTLLLASSAQAFLSIEDAHTKYLYPIVRVSTGRSVGSGTIIYSKENTDDPTLFETFVLTNHHVVANAIRIVEEWDSDEGEDVKKEKLSVVYVEIFQYRDLSTSIGTLKVEADIVAYTKDEDMALLKLRTENSFKYIANVFTNDDNIPVFSETVAVGCSLAFPPLPTYGILSRKGILVDSLEFWMSSSQIIYGNSGGAMFLGNGRLVGIPSLVAIVGWGTPITHMGLFIPIDRITNWLVEEEYEFLLLNNK